MADTELTPKERALVYYAIQQQLWAARGTAAREEWTTIAEKWAKPQ
jgi:hypothetical protein